MLRDVGFREAMWQHLHLASLSLMRQAVRGIRSQHSSSGSRGAVACPSYQPDADGCIDLTSDSHESSDSAAEGPAQVRCLAVSPTMKYICHAHGLL